jgi:hypothetical protein
VIRKDVAVKSSYKRGDAELEFGAGVVYVEFTAEWPTRQVDVRWTLDQIAERNSLEIHRIITEHY